MHKAYLLATASLFAAMFPSGGGQEAVAQGTAQQASAPAPMAAGAAPRRQASENPLEGRPDDVPPALKYLQSQGVTLTYIGNDGRLQAYLGEAAGMGGKMQTFYVTPDGQDVIAGVMFSAQGTDVTAKQLAQMQQRFEDAKQKVADQKRAADEALERAAAAKRSLEEQQQRIAEAQHQLHAAIAPPPPAPVPAEAPPAEMRSPELPTATQLADNSLQQPLPSDGAPASAPALPAAPAAAPQPAPAEATLSQFLSHNDKAAFLADMAHLPWFNAGHVGAPLVYMVADPQCPYCHSFWSQVRDKVTSGKLDLHIILVSALPGSEPLALSLLSRKDAGLAWLRGEGSVDNFAIAPPPPDTSPDYGVAQSYLSKNMAFLQKMKIKQTPWLAYVGKDGRLYENVGSQNVDVFLSGL